MGWVFLAGVAVVLICAAVFTVIERRRRAAFQKQIHDWVQTRIDQMKREGTGHGKFYEIKKERGKKEHGNQDVQFEEGWEDLSGTLLSG